MPATRQCHARTPDSVLGLWLRGQAWRSIQELGGQRQLVQQQARQQEVLADALAPRSPVARPIRVFSRRTIAWAQSSTPSTRRPPAPSGIWSGIRRRGRATTGVPFHSDSETTRPKPSRIDFWTTTSEALEGVDLDVADAGEVGEDVDQRIVLAAAPDWCRSPIPRGRRAPWSRRARAAGPGLLAGQPVRLDHAERVLPRVEAGDLRDQGPIGLDADPVEHLAGGRPASGKFFGLSGSIAGGMISTRETGKSGGTNSGIVKIAASYPSGARRKPQTAGFGCGCRCGSARPSARRRCRGEQDGGRLRVVDEDDVVGSSMRAALRRRRRRSAAFLRRQPPAAPCSPL